MATTPTPALMTRNARVRVQRILVIAIIFVSSLQFFVHDPTTTSQGHAPDIGSFYNDGRPSEGFGAKSRSSSATETEENSSIGSEAGASHTNTTAYLVPSLSNHGHANGQGLNNRSSEEELNANAKSSLSYAKITPDVASASVSAVHSNETKANVVFCGSCSHDKRNTCNERLQYMMGRYHLPEEKAREELMSKCGIDHSAEPYVLLHAGPHKTGTTSIQSFLYHSLWKNASFLQEDNFAIPTFDDLPGNFGDVGPMLNFAHCMISGFAKDGGNMNIGQCNKLRKTFPPFLQKHYNRSHHVLIVAEDLDRITIDQTRMQYYLKPYKRFRIVVAYRRLHEWLPSWYNQIVDLYISVYIQGEARYPSFVEWITKKYDHFIQVHALGVAERYRNSGKFESVDIVNMHDGVPLLENIFCNVAPFANATCQAILAGAKPPKPNIGRSHEYERLATKAFLQGKIKDFHRVIAPNVVNQIKKAVVALGLFGVDGDDYPKICLNQTFLDRLLQTEMEQERKYFPNWYESQGGDEGLRKEFENAKHKLCSMDDESILASGVLDPVFEQLNQ